MNQKKRISVVVFLSVVCIFLFSLITNFSQAEHLNQVNDVPSLVKAVRNGKNGDTILVSSGIFKLQQPLVLKSGMSIIGAGEQKTIITTVPTWKPSVEKLPKTEDPTAYLFHVERVADVMISSMTLTGGNLPGAIYANKVNGLELQHIHFEDFLWSSVRTFHMNNFMVHDNIFIDAGGKYRWTGGALFMNWTRNSEFWNNRIYRSANSTSNFFGFKGHGGKNIRFHHNDVRVNFSLEFPFENDQGIEIDHNNFAGVISIPKYAGGLVLKDELAYHIHHNWLKNSYALEWARNSVEVDHNLFDFETENDNGNLISNHGDKSSPGPTLFHDNLVRNPGRGILWTKGIYNRFYFYNNHVKANTLTKSNGFFGFNPQSDFKTIEIKNNIIENTPENPRPLMRNTESYSALIENNILKNISDTSAYTNSKTGKTHGPLKPLSFRVGAYGEYTVKNWNAIRTSLQPL